MFKAVLEVKKERNDGSIFYRYNIDGTKVWFDQYQDSGNIYAVYVRAGDEIQDDFKFCVQDGSQFDHYYPKYIEINTNHERLTVNQVCDYVNGLLYAKRIASAIMKIFENGKHKNLYEQFHKEEVK